VLLVLLPALAVLQYRWVGQVSVAERERMQRNLRNAAAQFRDAFDDEVRRAALSLQVGPATARDGASDRYTDRYTTWLDTAAHPQIVANVYLVDADAGRLRLRRWNPDASQFDATNWAEPLARWLPHFEQELIAFNTGRQFDRRGIYRDVPSLFISPLRNVITPPPGPQTITPVFGFTVLELNLPYVRERLLPELAQRHFSHTDESADDARYRVAVVEVDRPELVLYRSDATATIEADRADVTVSLLGRGGFGRAGFGPGPGPGPGPGAGRQDPRPNARADARDAGERGDGRDVDDNSGRWRLLVQHQSGSLEAAVAALRRRNLAVVFGVLALLSGSMALLAVTSRRAQTLARQQMEFVAGISHELRTPVAVIRSAGENLSQGVVGSADRVKKYGQMIEGEARRLGDMVERVLQYAGIESGLGFATRAPLAPADLIDAAVKSEATLAEPGLNVQREIAIDLPAVMGDQAALRSAVQNLLANAVKYGGRDRWIGIRAERARGRRSEVRITVSDHGAGIPAAELPHIFDPFYRGADALSRQIHGNGLGLSLVKRIVSAHGGTVTVSTKAGSGSAFTITLPAAEPDRSAVASEAQAPVHS
jgi:signal transduction histidine kinase